MQQASSDGITGTSTHTPERSEIVRLCEENKQLRALIQAIDRSFFHNGPGLSYQEWQAEREATFEAVQEIIRKHGESKESRS